MSGLTSHILEEGDLPACFYILFLLYYARILKGFVMPEKLKLLLVDDQDTLRKLMKDELIVQGYDVGDADSGKAALEILRLKHHDIVILDIRMDGMNGMEVLKHIRKDNLANKVIMLTAVDELKVAQDSLKFGANDFMSKPFDLKNLVTCINRTMKE